MPVLAEPGPAGHEVVQDVHGVLAVLAGGAGVASDAGPVLGGVVAGQAAGDLLLGYQRADPALADIVRGQMLGSVVKRSTSPHRSLQNPGSSRPGFCFVQFFRPGTRGTLASPARTACRNSRTSDLSTSVGMAVRPAASSRRTRPRHRR